MGSNVLFMGDLFQGEFSGSNSDLANPNSDLLASDAAASPVAVGKPSLSQRAGHPLSFVWWIVLVIMLFGLMWGAKRAGTADGNFGSIKLSAYNVLTISWAAIIGIVFFKALLTRWPVPGLTQVVQAV